MRFEFELSYYELSSVYKVHTDQGKNQTFPREIDLYTFTYILDRKLEIKGNFYKNS